MSEIIEELSPAPEGLRAIFYDEDPAANPQDGEPVVSIARVKAGARWNLVAVVISPEGELELATDDTDYLGLAWAHDTAAIQDILRAEFEVRHPEMVAKRKIEEAKAAKAAAKADKQKKPDR